MNVFPNQSDGSEARYRALRDLELGSAEALAQLTQGLSDEDWRVRKAAVDRLVELGTNGGALGALSAVLQRHGDVAARNAAAEALARIGVDAIPELSRLLQAEAVDVRKFAADILGDIGRPEGIEALAGALGDPDRNVRSSAAEALGKTGGPRAALALERALRMDDHLLRVSALDGLWRIGAVPPTSLLEPLSRDRFLRRSIYRLLGRAHDERSTEVLVEGVADPGRATREAALAGIAEQTKAGSGLFWGRLAGIVRRSTSRTEALVHAASEALNRDDPGAVEGALVLLGALGNVARVQQVVELGAQPRFRDAARVALAGMGNAATAPLLAALPALSPAALVIAGEHLGSGHGKAVEAQALVALDLAQPDQAAALLELLGAVGSATSARELSRRSGSLDLAEQVATALEGIARRYPAEVLELVRAEWRAAPTPTGCLLLGAVGTNEDTGALMGALHHRDASVRAAAAQALSRQGALRALESLHEGLTDESEEVRAACLRGLGVLRSPRLGEVVRTALQDPAPRVEVAAAEVAGASGLFEVAAALANLLAQSAGPAALAALEALNRLDRLESSVLESASEHASAEVCARALALSASQAGGMALVCLRLSHARWEVRRAAARVAGTAAGVDDLPSMRLALSKETDPLVLEALQAAVAATEARRQA